MSSNKLFLLFFSTSPQNVGRLQEGCSVPVWHLACLPRPHIPWLSRECAPLVVHITFPLMGLLCFNAAKKEIQSILLLFKLFGLIFSGLDGHRQWLDVHNPSLSWSPLSLAKTLSSPDFVLYENKTFPGSSASQRPCQWWLCPLQCPLWAAEVPIAICGSRQRNGLMIITSQVFCGFDSSYMVFLTPGVAECFIFCMCKCSVFSTARSFCKSFQSSLRMIYNHN